MNVEIIFLNAFLVKYKTPTGIIQKYDVQNLLGIYLFPFSPWYLSLSEKTDISSVTITSLFDKTLVALVQLSSEDPSISKMHVLGFAAFSMTYGLCYRSFAFLKRDVCVFSAFGKVCDKWGWKNLTFVRNSTWNWKFLLTPLQVELTMYSVSVGLF